MKEGLKIELNLVGKPYWSTDAGTWTGVLWEGINKGLARNQSSLLKKTNLPRTDPGEGRALPPTPTTSGKKADRMQLA